MNPHAYSLNMFGNGDGIHVSISSTAPIFDTRRHEMEPPQTQYPFAAHRVTGCFQSRTPSQITVTAVNSRKRRASREVESERNGEVVSDDDDDDDVVKKTCKEGDIYVAAETDNCGDVEMEDVVIIYLLLCHTFSLY